MNKITEFIKSEYKRNHIALFAGDDQFISSYYEKNGTLTDGNTSSFWGDKIFCEKANHNPMYDDKINIVYKYLKNESGNVLSLGFGSGLLEKKLYNFNKKLKFFGSDISKKAVKKISKIIPGVYRSFSFLNIPFQDSYFDFVVALDVFEHVEASKILRIIKEIHRVLRNGGSLIVSVPVNEGLENLLVKGLNPNQHMRIYSQETLRRELFINKFRIIKERKLFAFDRFYCLKSALVKIFRLKSRQPNLYIVIAKK